MILNRFQRGKLKHTRGNDLRHERHHVEFGIRRLILGDHFLVDHALTLPATRLHQSDACIAGGLSQWIGTSSFSLGRREYTNNLMSVGDQPLENGCAKWSLSDQGDTHSDVLSSASEA